MCTNGDDDTCIPVDSPPSSDTSNTLVQHKFKRLKEYQELNTGESTAKNVPNGSHPRRYTEADLGEATNLVESPAGMLYYHASKAVIQLCEYRTATVQQIGLEPDAPNEVPDGPDAGDVDLIMENWCHEFTNLTGRPCDVHEPFNEILAGTRCVLEAAATEYGYPTLPMFATAMELFEAAAEDCMPPLANAFGSIEQGAADSCPGEWGAVADEAREDHVTEENTGVSSLPFVESAIGGNHGQS